MKGGYVVFDSSSPDGGVDGAAAGCVAAAEVGGAPRPWAGLHAHRTVYRALT
jgi:hypothetical protein